MPQSPPASEAVAAPAPGGVPTAFSQGPQQGYQVVARRYRPQRFDELVGQEHVAHGLSGAIESGRIGHAYLFTGARGVGKTSAARIYAKALECSNGSAAEPCNTCEKCLSISAGQDVDVVEIDAASNRGVDEMRQLRQNVGVRPARGRFKTYIIDEVHMLTREAFNALLKTLEEPPAHVKFVLCTTEPEKLPITILSRCQRFDFQTVEPNAIARRLAQIVEAEGAVVAPEAIRLIARRAAGSMRDSQSLLEQLLGGATGPIGVDDVHAVIGTGREEKVGELVAAVAARDARGALLAFDAAVASGADPGGVLEQVMAALRDSLLASVGCGAEVMLQGDGLGVDLAALGRNAGTTTLLAMLQIIDHALDRMRLSGHATVLAEMAIVRLACLEDLDSLAAAVERVAAGADQSAASAAGEKKKLPPLMPARAVPTTTPEPVVVEAVGRAEEPAAVDPDAKVLRATAPVEAAEPPQESRAEPAAETALPADSLGAWHRAGEAVGGLAADFAALASRAAWRDDLLEITLPSTAANAVSFLRRPEIASGLTQALADIVGRPIRHAIVIDASVETALASHRRGAGPAPGARPAASQSALLRESLEHPLVLHALTLFDAAVRKVEPPRPRPAAAVPTPQAGAAVADEDESTHAADDHGPSGAEGMSPYGGTDG